MKRTFILITFTGVLAKVICAPVDVQPCNEEDSECLTKLTKLIYPSAITGDDKLGIPSSDPMKQEFVEGKFNTLTYTLTDSTLKGFKDCQIESTTAITDQNSVEFKMVCPKFEMTGHYSANGKILETDIKGDGEYRLDATDVYITITAEIKKTPRDNGKSILSFEKFKVKPKVRGVVKIDLSNLFGGDKSLADPVLKMLNENWPIFVEELQGPIFDANVGKMRNSFNKFLELITSDNILKP
ncbi:hypothetical protein K1T71_001370 [Dendrolimus kikuchii]|uniref:Uncharacterized protein n=1 Tax=Dendrolimus kikuchii TaxID=765133 RepID=A0ACC1DHE2_9NEOP|nr:hypothetical protein K1T71_001370 [Dendrolimus kikuchii]